MVMQDYLAANTWAVVADWCEYRMDEYGRALHDCLVDVLTTAVLDNLSDNYYYRVTAGETSEPEPYELDGVGRVFYFNETGEAYFVWVDFDGQLDGEYQAAHCFNIPARLRITAEDVSVRPVRSIG